MTPSQATLRIVEKNEGSQETGWRAKLKATLDESVWRALSFGGGFVLLIGPALLGAWVVQVENAADAQKSTLIEWLQEAERDRDKATQKLAQAENRQVANQRQLYTDFLRYLSTTAPRSNLAKHGQ